jgi:glycosyltransferase involved in cell wall biosynthesis
MFDNLHVLYPVALYPMASGGSLRTLNIARLAQSNFRSVCVYCVDESIEYEGNVDDVHVYQSYKYLGNIDRFSYYAKSLFYRNFSLKSPECAFTNKNSTIFQLEGPYFYNLLKKRGIKTYVLNEHNVYWELLDFPSYSPKKWLYNQLGSKRDKNIEVMALRDATQILVCSERDKQIISENVRNIEDKMTIIPNCVDFIRYTTYQAQHSAQFNRNDKKRVLFTGGLSYPPNRDAVDTICNYIAPHFGDNVEFIIAGSNPPKIQIPQNVTFLGYVEDIMQMILQSDICIAPLRYGSGTRFKILEYMAMGKPVVSTSKGAEGINYTNHRDIVIEDDFTEFSGRIADLLEDHAMREQLGKSAQELIRQKYDWEIYRKPLREAYEACC